MFGPPALVAVPELGTLSYLYFAVIDAPRASYRFNVWNLLIHMSLDLGHLYTQHDLDPDRKS